MRAAALAFYPSDIIQTPNTFGSRPPQCWQRPSHHDPFALPRIQAHKCHRSISPLSVPSTPSNINSLPHLHFSAWYRTLLPHSHESPLTAAPCSLPCKTLNRGRKPSFPSSPQCQCSTPSLGDSLDAPFSLDCFSSVTTQASLLVSSLSKPHS
jgi:hypothetical protein